MSDSLRAKRIIRDIEIAAAEHRDSALVCTDDAMRDKLRELALKFLTPESKSTNPLHRQYLARERLHNWDDFGDSVELSDLEFDILYLYVDSDFDINVIKTSE